MMKDAALLGAGLAAGLLLKSLYQVLLSPLSSSAAAATAASCPEPGEGLWSAVGDTKTIKIPSLSAALGHDVFVKLEFLNPSGTAKDRAVRQMLSDAEASGQLRPGDTVFEGSAGSTGISLALLGAAHGFKVWFRVLYNHIFNSCSL